MERRNFLKKAPVALTGVSLPTITIANQALTPQEEMILLRNRMIEVAKQARGREGLAQITIMETEAKNHFFAVVEEKDTLIRHCWYPVKNTWRLI